MKSKNKKFKRILIIGGSKGIGNAVYKNIKSLSLETLALSRKDLDTSIPESVNNFCAKYKTADVIFLNSGGPPPKPFRDISNEEWIKYFNQLFLGFATILKKIKIKKIFLAGIKKEPITKKKIFLYS